MLMDYGLPQMFQGDIMPPFDVVSHSLRGMKGTMLDMFRQPDKLLELCDFLLEKALERPTPPPNEYGNVRMFMTNTRGSDNFMSNEQFERFYWPHCKKLLLTLIERGMHPLHVLRRQLRLAAWSTCWRFPKGSMLVRLDTYRHLQGQGDPRRPSLHRGQRARPRCSRWGRYRRSRDYCKKLIDVVGKGGGFILSPRSSTHYAKPENLKAMVDFTKEYGRY